MQDGDEPEGIGGSAEPQAGGADVPPVSQQAPNPENQAAANEGQAERAARIAEIAKRRRRERRKQTFKFYAEILGALATVAVAGLTAAYVYYSGEQWKVSRDALQQTRISNKMTSRNVREQVRSNRLSALQFKLSYQPLLVFEPPPVARPQLVPTKDGYRLSWPVKYRNAGHGIALNIREMPWMGSSGSAFPPPRALTWRHLPEPSKREISVVTPLAPGTIQEAQFPGDIPKKMGDAVLSGKETLSLQLVLRYYDELGHMRYSSVCATYLTATSMHSCDEGNYND